MFVTCPVAVHCSTMNKIALFFLSLLAICIARKRNDERPSTTLDVHSDLGTYRGFSTFSESGKLYYRFRGIRYVMGPGFYKRFDEARPYNEKWTGNRPYYKYQSDCIGFDNLHYALNVYNRTYEVTGDEDCLFLNVHTSSIVEKVPVVFFIHGGGFGFGGPSQFDSHFIMNRPIVYVNIAYRLGPLGFLSTGDNIVPGNMGLKDQLLALQWVNKNIELFGGDKNRITITGMSAGGVSVHYMYLSPLTDGLFQRGFTHSGSALCPWALFKDIPQKTRKLARLLDCPDGDSYEMVECLRRVSAYDLVLAMRHFKVFMFNPFTIFGPVVDSQSLNPYLPKDPLTLLQDNRAKDLPFITGVTAEDGLYSASEWILNENIMKGFVKKWSEYLPSILFYDGEKCNEAATQLLNYMLKLRHYATISFNSALLQIITYRLYVASALQSSSLMAKRNTAPVHLFYFKYRGGASTSDILKNDEDTDYGLVGHADDCAYIYYLSGFELRKETEDQAMSDEMLDLITSFAENATLPESFNMWVPLNGDPERFNYLEITGAKNYAAENRDSVLNYYMEKVLGNCAL